MKNKKIIVALVILLSIIIIFFMIFFLIQREVEEEKVLELNTDEAFLHYYWNTGYFKPQIGYSMYIFDDGKCMLTASSNFEKKEYILSFQQEEILLLHNLIDEINFFELPQDISNRGVLDAGSDYITIKLDEKEYKSGGYAAYLGGSTSFIAEISSPNEGFSKLCSYLRTLVSDEIKETYLYFKDLPRKPLKFKTTSTLLIENIFAIAIIISLVLTLILGLVNYKRYKKCEGIEEKERLRRHKNKVLIIGVVICLVLLALCFAVDFCGTTYI